MNEAQKKMISSLCPIQNEGILNHVGFGVNRTGNPITHLRIMLPGILKQIDI